MKLTRITSGGKFIPEIDGLRFVAIASVVAFHIYEYLLTKAGAVSNGYPGIALRNGQRGVPLFFVISGFILGWPFAAHYLRGAPAPKLKEYYLRRLTRLEPPYVVALVAVFLGLAVFTTNRGIFHLFASLTYLHNMLYGAPNPFFGLAWSLEIEVQFYCLIPLLALIFTLPRASRRLILVACMFLGAFNVMALPERVHLSILGWFQCFAAGMLLADLYTDWNPSQHWAFDLLSLVLWPAVFLAPDKAAIILLPAFALLLYISAFRSVLFRKLFRHPLITTIGGMCYTIYLIHFEAISIIGRATHNPPLFVALSLLLIAAASITFFVLVERPCMNKDWPKELARRFRPDHEQLRPKPTHVGTQPPGLQEK